MKRPTIKAKRRDQYSRADETIVEVSGPSGGFLLSLLDCNGNLRVQVYRADGSVSVRLPGDREERQVSGGLLDG